MKKLQDENQETKNQNSQGFLTCLNFYENSTYTVEIEEEQKSQSLLFTNIKIYPENTQIQFSNQKSISETKIQEDKSNIEIYGKQQQKWILLAQTSLEYQNKIMEVKFEDKPCEKLLFKSKNNILTILCVTMKKLENDIKENTITEKKVNINKEFSIKDLLEITDQQFLKNKKFIFENKNSSLEKFLSQIRQIFYNHDPKNLQQNNFLKELSEINQFLLENQAFRKEKLPESYSVFSFSNDVDFQSFMNTLNQTQSQLNSLVQILNSFALMKLQVKKYFQKSLQFQIQIDNKKKGIDHSYNKSLQKLCFILAGKYPQFFKKCKSKIQTKYLYKLRAERYLQKTEEISFYLYDYYMYFSEQSNLLYNILNKQIQGMLQINSFFKEIKESILKFLNYKICKQNYLENCPGADINGLINQKIKNKKKDQQVYYYLFNFTVKIKRNLLNIQESWKKLLEQIKKDKNEALTYQCKILLQVYIQDKFFELKFENFFKLLQNEHFLVTTKMIKCSITYILDLFKLLISNIYQLKKKQQFLNEIENLDFLKDDRKSDFKFIYNEIQKYEKVLQFKKLAKKFSKDDKVYNLQFLNFLINNHNILQFVKTYYKNLLCIFFSQIEKNDVDYQLILHIQFILLNQNKVNLVKWIFKNIQNYNITKLIKAFQTFQLQSSGEQQFKKDNKDIQGATTQYNIKNTNEPVIVELFIFIKTITHQNMQNQQRLQKFDCLLQMKSMIIQQNQKLPYEYFRKNEAKLTNQEFEIFENLIKKQNSINQNQFWCQFLDISRLIIQYDNSFDVLFLQAFISYFTQQNIIIHQISNSENQNFITMIYNIFIYCANYLNLYLGTSNIYFNYCKFQAVRQFIQMIEFCVEFLYIKHPRQKLDNTYLINAIFRIAVIFYQIQDIGVRKGTVNEIKDDRSIFIKIVKSTTDKLEYICYKHIEVQSLFLGFSRIIFEGCNLNYLLEFLCKIYSQADVGDYRPLTDFFMVNNIQKTTLLNLMYQDDLINFFAKFNNQQNNFIMFIIHLIWSFSLEEFEINKHLIYRFLDQILSNKIQKLYLVLSNFYSYCLKKIQEKITIKEQNQESNDEGLEKNCQKKIFKNLKQMNFSLCLLLKSLCNPIFKSYFINQKKTETLIQLMQFLFLNEQYQKQKEEYTHLCNMIDVNLLNCLQICVDHKFGIRSLIKSQKQDNLEKIQMVEDMPIEKHILKIFQTLIKIDYKNIQTEDVLEQMIELLVLLSNNLNGKNIIMSLRSKNEQQNLFQTIMEKIHSPKTWLVYIKFILNFMEKPKKILNLQLMSYLLNVKKNQKNDVHINKLLEYFQQLEQKNKDIKKDNQQKFLQIRIDYAYDIIEKSIQKISQKKQKFQKYFNKKVQTNYIDLLPEDMDKRFQMLEKELGTNKNNNNEINNMIKNKKFNQLSNKTIQFFKQQNIEDLANHFYNIQTLNTELNILTKQYKFEAKINQFTKVDAYWKFQYKPYTYYGKINVPSPNAKIDYQAVQIQQQIQKQINQQTQVQQNNEKEENKIQKQNFVQENNYIQKDFSEDPEFEHQIQYNNLIEQQQVNNYIHEQPILNFQDATYQNEPQFLPVQNPPYHEQQYHGNYMEIPDQFNSYQNHILPQNNLLPNNLQAQVTEQQQPYILYQDHMMQNNSINNYVSLQNDQLAYQQQYADQYYNSNIQDPNMMYYNQFEQPPYMYNQANQQYYNYQLENNEYTIDNNNFYNNFEQNQYEQVYDPNVDNNFENEDEGLKDVEFSDGEDHKQNNNQNKKQNFFDKFKSKK